MGDPPQCDDIAGHPLGASRRLWFYQTLYPAGTSLVALFTCSRNRFSILYRQYKVQSSMPEAIGGRAAENRLAKKKLLFSKPPIMTMQTARIGAK